MLCSPASAIQASPPEVKRSDGIAQSLQENTAIRKAAGVCGSILQPAAHDGQRKNPQLLAGKWF